MRKDYDGNNEIVEGSIRELSALLRELKRQHLKIRCYSIKLKR